VPLGLAARKRMTCRLADGRRERARRDERERLGETARLGDSSRRSGCALDGGQPRNQLAPPVSPTTMGVVAGVTMVQAASRRWVKERAWISLE
jgi:hypothetical protein